jgi:hypothetical protein
MYMSLFSRYFRAPAGARVAAALRNAHVPFSRKLAVGAALVLALAFGATATRGLAASSTPKNSALPQISGALQVGQKLTASTGTWSGSPTSYAYQWQYSRDKGAAWLNVNGATTNTLLESSTFQATLIRVRVTAKNSMGSTTVSSAAVGPVAAAPVSPMPAASSLPQISGSMKVGQTLTTTSGTWTGSPTGYAYQWQYSRDTGATWLDVSGATTTVFQESSTFQGALVRARVTASNSTGATSVTSTPAGPIAAVVAAPTNTALPQINGTAQVGQTLTATNGTWTDSPTGYTYQWQLSSDGGTTWTSVSGATSATVSESSAFQGALVRVNVSATNAGGTTTIASPAVGPVAALVVAPVTSSLPQVNGTLRVGQYLSATNGTWTGSPTGYAYQWQYSRDNGATWLDVSGATTTVFQESSTFQDTLIRARITATNSAGSTTAASAAVGPVVALVAAPTNTALPLISGTAQIGQTLTAATGTWTGSPTSYTYQWQRCDTLGLACVALTGASGPSYALGASDVGTTLRVSVSASNSTGSASASSAATPTVLAGPSTTSTSYTVSPFGSWEGATKTSEFSDSTCHNDRITLQSTTVREGTKAATWSADTSVHCYNDTANVRVHMLGWPSGKGVNMGVGSTYWFTTSVFFPTTAPIPSSGWYTLTEVHQDHTTGCTGSAPFNLDAVGGQWRLIVRGYGSCTTTSGGQVFDQSTWGTPVTDNGSNRRSFSFANGVPYTVQKGQWYDFLFGVHVATDKTGWFEAWMNGPGTNGRSVQIVNRTYLPTSYPTSNYPVLSVYYPVSGNSTAQVVYDGVAFSTDFAGLKAWQNSFTGSW